MINTQFRRVITSGEAGKSMEVDVITGNIVSMGWIASS